MVDLWGPGAYGAADASATLPPYTPANAPGDPDTFYKDCSSPAEDDGTEWKAAALNALLAQMRAIARAGSAPVTNLDPQLLIKQIASGAFSHAVATGGANAWIIAPSLAVPAYAAGRVLWVKAPATNTLTTVTGTVSGLGARSIKKRDGVTDPAVGDLVAGHWYPTFDDGTSICIVVPLPSETTMTVAQRLAQPYLGFHGDPVSLSIPSAAQTLISSYTGITNNLPGASQSGGVITIGTAGFYQVTANMASLLADYTSAYGAAISVSKVNGSNVPILSVAATPLEIISSNLPSTRAAAASGIAKLAAGDRIGAFMSQNRGSSQNVSVSLDIEFRGA